jgi:hypothetical protein
MAEKRKYPEYIYEDGEDDDLRKEREYIYNNMRFDLLKKVAPASLGVIGKLMAEKKLSQGITVEFDVRGWQKNCMEMVDALMERTYKG